jgi:hypothetical protein
MKRKINFLLRIAMVFAIQTEVFRSEATTMDPPADSSSPCANIPHGDHPKELLSNGKLVVVVFLPDKNDGYYRSTRFDWSGLIPCASLKGHRFFGEWSSQYDPSKNDAVTGPAEEFRTNGGPIGHFGPKGQFVAPAGAIGYSEAKPGGLFLKPGVGVLQKIDDRPYQFGFPYPIVDVGCWTVKRKSNSIRFRQVLNGPDGYAYVYEKVVSIEKNDTMTLAHRLTNTGKKTIETNVYDHDFFMIDGKPTGPGMAVRFAFAPKPEDPLGPEVKIDGKELTFLESPKRAVSAYLTGYSNKPSDYDFTVEDTHTHVGIRQTSDQPLYRLYFWSTSSTICPEAYLHLSVRPGETSRWKIHYRFIAPG